MRNFFLQFFTIFLLLPFAVHAERPQQFPNVSGNVLFQVQADRLLSTSGQNIPLNNSFFYAEPNMALNFDRNWSIKTDWRLQPNNVLTTRNSTYPERYRTFLQTDRGFGLNDTGLLIEELKVNFENDDVRFFAGKFDPTFGTAWRKSKRIGVFTSQFTEDYNLREKLGFGVAALLENSQVTFNSFFNDTTGLSSSAINNRGRASSNNMIAGNTGTLSSYSVSMEGEKLLGLDNWFYNFGYRNLGVEAMSGRAREVGYVFGTEYLYKLSRQTSIIPFIELTKINNFTGAQGRNGRYSTIAIMSKYNGWTASVSYLKRNIAQSQNIPKSNDGQLQFSIGYKFTDNLTLDVSRANLKENNTSGALIGATLSYLYKF